MEIIESIELEIEYNLKKPQEYLPKLGIKSVLNDIFSTRKPIISNTNEQINDMNEKESLEILHYSFDTNEKSFFNYKRSSLIQGLILAYKNHYPITVTPDMIWILFLQGFSRFMEKFHDSVREEFVSFSGKKDLNIERLELTPYTATKEDWDGIMKEFVEKISEHIGQETIDNLECNFSTTTQVAQVTSQVSIMSAMKQYFNYKLKMRGCGISSINLEGSMEDWEKIKKKLEFLSNKKLNCWTKKLIPIIDKILETKNYYNYNGQLSEELIDFWKGMIRVKGKGGLYDPHIINGWIVKFIPILSNKKLEIYDEINEKEIPNQIIRCPMELTCLLSKRKKIEYSCSLFSGFYGMTQDKETFNVRPVIGYVIVVDNKIEVDITEEEKNKIDK